MKVKKVSYNLGNIEVEHIAKQSKKAGMNNTDYVRSIIAKDMDNIDITKFAKGGDLDVQDLNILEAVGVGTLSGIIGYKMAKYIRQKYTQNENEAVEMLTGLLTGLGGMLLDITSQGKRR